MSMRIGNGYDAHRLAPGRKLILGGVEIPHAAGLLGHSDADVLTHAIIDALLGAAGLGDIGSRFPDSEAKYKNIVSLLLLRAVSDLLAERRMKVINVDSVVVAQEPRLAPYTDDMRGSLAACLGLSADAVSVKATTEEGMGFTGKKKGIAAYAVCLLEHDLKNF